MSNTKLLVDQTDILANNINSDPIITGLPASANNIELALKNLNLDINLVNDSVTAHISDSVSAHNASVIGTDPLITGLPASANNIELALQNLKLMNTSSSTDIINHLNDTVSAHNAEAIGTNPLITGLPASANNVELALHNLNLNVDLVNDSVTAHISDNVTAHSASAIGTDPLITGLPVSATNVELALQNLNNIIGNSDQDLSTDGYVILPNGIIMQWGISVSATDPNGAYTEPFIFKMSFPNSVLSIIPSIETTGFIAGLATLQIFDITQNGFTCGIDEFNSGINTIKFRYLAIGY